MRDGSSDIRQDVETCPDCGGEWDLKAEPLACPHCGLSTEDLAAAEAFLVENEERVE